MWHMAFVIFDCYENFQAFSSANLVDENLLAFSLALVK